MDKILAENNLDTQSFIKLLSEASKEISKRWEIAGTNAKMGESLTNSDKVCIFLRPFVKSFLKLSRKTVK